MAAAMGRRLIALQAILMAPPTQSLVPKYLPMPSSRALDSMPYSGFKDSGLARGSVRFAMEDMTEIL